MRGPIVEAEFIRNKVERYEIIPDSEWHWYFRYWNYFVTAARVFGYQPAYIIPESLFNEKLGYVWRSNG